MIHRDLKDYYTTVFNLVQHHKYSISEIEGLIPYEMDLYVDMLGALLSKLAEGNKEQ